VNEESLLKRIGVLTFEGLQSAMCKLSDVEIKKTNNFTRTDKIGLV